jgi:hypothetical protein
LTQCVQRPGTIDAIATLRHHALESRVAGGAEEVWADLALLEWRDEMPSGRRAQVVAVRCEQVEGVQLHLVVMLAGDEAVEVGHAVDAQHHGLAINDELLSPIWPVVAEITVSTRPSTPLCFSSGVKEARYISVVCEPQASLGPPMKRPPAFELRLQSRAHIRPDG